MSDAIRNTRPQVGSTTPPSAAPVAGGGPTIAPADGIIDDSHRTARNVLTTVGILGGLAGAAAGGLQLLRASQGAILSANGRIGAIAGVAAGLGAALLVPIIAHAALGSEHRSYDLTVSGSRSDALMSAAGMGGDVGVVPISQQFDKWGLLQLQDTNVDGDGPASVSYPSNAPLTFDSIVTRDGDAHVRGADGGFANTGAPGAVDVTAIDPANTAAVSALAGSRLALDPQGAELTVGKPMFGAAPFATEGEALRALANQGVRNAVLVRVGSGAAVATVVFEAGPLAGAGNLAARGTELRPVSSATLVTPGGVEHLVYGRRATAPGVTYASTPAEATPVDVSKLDARDPKAAAAIVGQRIGVAGDASSERVMTIGAPLLGGASFPTGEAAMAELFEAGTSSAVLVQVGSGAGAGVLAFAADGAMTTSLDATAPRHPMLAPQEAVTVIAPDPVRAGGIAAHGLSGGAFVDSTLRPEAIDTTVFASADAGKLTGLRIGVDNAGAPTRLGTPLGTHATIGEATQAAMASGARELIVPLAAGAAARFALGSASTIDTRLAPLDQLRVVTGPKSYTISDAGSIDFERRLTPFDPSEPIGQRTATGLGAGIILAHIGSFQDEASAVNAIRGDLNDRSFRVVLNQDGPAGSWHAYELGGDVSGTPTWDNEMAPRIATAAFNADIRTTQDAVESVPSTYGTDVVTYRDEFSHAARLLSHGGSISEVAATAAQRVSRTQIDIVRAFDPNEAIGHTVSIGGQSLRIDRWIDSTDISSSAQSRISTAASDDRAYVVLEQKNNRGAYHVYEATIGYTGNGWDDGRAHTAYASWTEPHDRRYDETERASGQYGTDVYHYDVSENWRTREVSSGYGSSTTDTTSVNRTRVLNYVDYAPKPAPPPPTPPSGGHTSPGDDGGNSGGSTSPGDDGGSSGGSTSPGDDGGSSGGSTSPGDEGGYTPAPAPAPAPAPSPSPSPSNGDSTDNGDPSEDDF